MPNKSLYHQPAAAPPQSSSLQPPRATTMQDHLIFLFLFPLPLLVFLFTWLSNPNKQKSVPPGTMGLPYVGETYRLYNAKNPNTFFNERQKKYGDIFKTRLLGCPCVMISSPEAVRSTLVNEAHLFKPTYPRSKERLLGAEAIFFQAGDKHLRLKKLVQSSLLPSSIREFVMDIERLVLGFLPAWGNKTINTLKEMKGYTLDVAVLSVFGEGLDHAEKELIIDLYESLDKGYNCLPINLPGTTYRKALMARKQLDGKLERMVQRRRESRNQGGGLLGALLSSTDGENKQLSKSQITDNIIGVIFAARDTTASVITWILKYLHDNEDYLAAVTREQEGIQRKMIEENRGLAWEDTRRMSFTNKVIQETLRAASVLPFVFREAVENIEFQGYLIPKGWKVLPLLRSIHHSENFFPQPAKFDPSRFEVQPRPNTCIPFGSGAHSCPGSEMAKLEIMVLIHHLTTTYRWEVIGNKDGIEYGPFLVPKGGLPIRVTKKNTAWV